MSTNPTVPDHFGIREDEKEILRALRDEIGGEVWRVVEKLLAPSHSPEEIEQANQQFHEQAEMMCVLEDTQGTLEDEVAQLQAKLKEAREQLNRETDTLFSMEHAYAFQADVVKESRLERDGAVETARGLALDVRKHRRYLDTLRTKSRAMLTAIAEGTRTGPAFNSLDAFVYTLELLEPRE